MKVFVNLKPDCVDEIRELTPFALVRYSTSSASMD